MTVYKSFDDIPVGVWVTEIHTIPTMRLKFQKTSRGVVAYTFSDTYPNQPGYEAEWSIKEEAYPPFEDWNPDE